MRSWWEFLVLCWFLTMLPGIDTAQILRSSIKGGPRLAYLTLFGIMCGVWFWGIITALGVSALLVASKNLYTALTYIGAAYLLYLGIRMVFEARRSGGLNLNAIPEEAGHALRRAFMITFTNPKNGAFYVAVFPQFLPESMNPIIAGGALSSIHNFTCLVWFTGVIALTNKAKKFFAQPIVGKRMEIISGLALIGFGISMVLESL